MGFYDPHNNFNSNKPSSNYNYQQESASGYQNERGGCLTTYLIVSALLTVFGMFALCTLLSELNEVRSFYRQRDTSQLQCIAMAAMGLGVAQLVCIAGLWNYKRWGYQGLLGLMVLSVATNLCTGNLLQLVGNFIGLAMLYYLVNPIQHVLE